MTPISAGLYEPLRAIVDLGFVAMLALGLFAALDRVPGVDVPPGYREYGVLPAAIVAVGSWRLGHRWHARRRTRAH